MMKIDEAALPDRRSRERRSPTGTARWWTPVAFAPARAVTELSAAELANVAGGQPAQSPEARRRASGFAPVAR